MKASYLVKDLAVRDRSELLESSSCSKEKVENYHFDSPP